MPRGEWQALSKRHNVADDRFLARPEGVCLWGHCCVAYTDVGQGREHAYMDVGSRATQEQLPRSGSFAILVKGLPFPADRALHWPHRRTLNVTVLVTRYTQ